LAFGTLAAAQERVELSGPACTTPAYLHCPDADCVSDRVINPGAVVEMNSRRTYFLDYPCDLAPGEQVTFILSLHGGGSYANWQRHYFPLLDYKDSHRLVIATPSSPIRVWTEADDQYLQEIVTSVVEQLGKDNIKAFWLAGHSQGGMTSNRLLRTEFFAQRVDGWLSLSGGRLGGSPPRASSFGPPRAATRPSTGPTGSEVSSSIAASRARLRELPETEFSFIFTTGEREMGEGGLPEASEWALRLGCGERKRHDDVVDTKPGYVYDSTRQNPPNPAWGLPPGPGSAAVYQYTDCKKGRVVADVVRLEKGHTEGLEPNVTKRLVELMLSADGGKIRNLD
jgi:pimeloyl-ACP methyl ester carboxylesterase